MTNPNLSELGSLFAQKFQETAKDVWASWTEAEKKTALECFEDGARVSALALLDPGTAKVEIRYVESSLKDLKVAGEYSLTTGFWSVVKSVLAVVAPILLKALVMVLA